MLLTEYNETYVITVETYIHMNTINPKFGPNLKALRLARKISLRQFSIDAEADPGNISRIERGILPPPQNREILIRYAKALGLEEASDEWFNFFDYASAERGMIPGDLMKNDDIVNFLPAFFRTLRGNKPSDEEMGSIIELIRNS